jgi:hypothetical protein
MPSPRKNADAHFSDELTVVKILEIEVPTPFMLARIARAIPAITSPYSMAVAADRSAKKPESKSFKTIPSRQRQDGSPAFDNQPWTQDLKILPTWTINGASNAT